MESWMTIWGINIAAYGTSSLWKQARSYQFARTADWTSMRKMLTEYEVAGCALIDICLLAVL